MPLDFPLHTTPTQEHLCLFLSVYLLESDAVQEFVADVRKREAVVPPITHEDLQANLRDHPPEQFEDDALLVAREVLQDEMEDLPEVREALQRVDEQVQELAIDATGDATSMLATFDVVVELDPPSQHGARIISRYTVCGLLEPPEPLPLHGTGTVYTTENPETGPMVVAMATPAADLDQLIADFRATCREHFLPGKRHRVPGSFTETVWLRFCRREIDRDGDEEGRMDMQLAELAHEIWPDTRPNHDIASPQYEAELRKKADRIRANSTNFDNWRDRYFPDLPTSER